MNKVMNVLLIVSFVWIAFNTTVSCTDEKATVKVKGVLEEERPQRPQSKFKFPACFRIVDSEDPYHNCEFFSEQGSMVVDNVKGESKLHIIFNRKINCLGDGPHFVDEDVVEKIDCPQELYK